MIELYYPTDTLYVTLRSPEYGDSHDVNITRIYRMSRGLALQVYNDPQWPRTETFKVKSVANTFNDKQLYNQFVQDSLGKLIRYMDCDSRLWEGYLTDTSALITEQTRQCGYTIQFDFIGSIVI